MADIQVEEYLLFRFSKLQKDNYTPVGYNYMANSYVGFTLKSAAEEILAQEILNDPSLTIDYIVLSRNDRINVNNI